MEFENLLLTREGKVATVTVNRPKTLNALNVATVLELHACFEDLAADEDVRAIILTGAGEKSFVAGADIPEINELNNVTGKEFAKRGNALYSFIESMTIPVIAAVNGFALGGGCELAMACDIRLASEKAKLGQPEVNLGIIPGYGGTQRLSRLVGRGKAMQLILTGDMISAQEAHRIGLVDEVYPPEELMDKAMQMANTICSKGPIAVAMAKECINRGLDVNLTAGCDLEKANFGSICGTGDKNEGTEAFMEKRKPNFTGH